MKIGDNVVIVSKYGEFQNNIEGHIVSLYRDDKVIVKTEAGHEWAIDKSDIRVIKKKTHSSWNM